MADLRGVQGTCASPLGVQILSISCGFWEILAKSYVGAPHGELAPPPQGNPGSTTDLDLYVDENCIDKSVCHRPKFFIVDLQSIFLIKYHYCVMENSLQNLVSVVKNAFWQLIVAYLLK